MFVNLSNHASDNWSQAQRDAAQGLGGPILDFEFPEVPPEDDFAGVERIAEQITATAMEWKPLAVMVQGEFTLTYRLVKIFELRKVPCYAATSRRVTETFQEAGGATVKKTRFEFVRFRRYEE